MQPPGWGSLSIFQSGLISIQKIGTQPGSRRTERSALQVAPLSDYHLQILASQVSGLDHFAGFELLDITFENNPANLQGIAFAGHSQRQGNILLDQQNADPPGIDVFDHRDKLGYHQRCQTKRGFIHQEKFWVCHQTTPDCHHLLLAAAECAGLLIASFIQTWEMLEDVVQILFDRLRVLAQARTEF